MSVRTILCPIDFSPGSRDAMRVAARIASETDAELVLGHVWYIPAVAFAGEPYVLPAQAIATMNAETETRLAEARREASELGARRVRVALLEGVPWERIVRAAEDEPKADLIVMGTHGRTGLTRWVLGSVAEQVVRHAPCPVLVARPNGEPGPFTDVLVPVDFSGSSDHALDLAVELARPGGSGITLLHVVEAPLAYSGEPLVYAFLRDIDKQAAKVLEDTAERLRAKTTVPVATRTRLGNAGAQILAALDDDPAFDLVVMGSHGRTGIKRALLGSVAEKVIRHAHCPVLVARQEPR